MSTILRSPATIADVNAEGSSRRWLALPLAAFLIYWLLLRAIFFSTSHDGGALTILLIVAAIRSSAGGIGHRLETHR